MIIGPTNRTDARPIFTGKHRSHGDMLYNARLRRYLLITYDSFPGKKRASYELAVARKPWGPWKNVWRQRFSEYYGQPTMPVAHIAQDGRTVWLFTSNDATTARASPETTKYCLHAMRLTLEP